MDSLVVNKVEMIAKSDVVDLYKYIAAQQSSDFTILIMVFSGLTLLLVGSTWVWNFVMAKKQINNEIQDQVSQVQKELATQIDNLVITRFSELEKNIDKKLRANEANTARLYAINCANQQLHSTSISWWITALKLYSESNNEYFIRICVEAILGNVNIENWFNDWDDNFLNIDQAIQHVETYVPALLLQEKRQIIFQLSSRRRVA